MEPVIVVHGGAWAIPDSLCKESREGVKRAALEGHLILTQPGGTALTAVETAVSCMENDPVFDAGTGSFLNSAGQVQMDAMIMEGTEMRAGSVACVQNILHPVKLARLVMEKTDHILLVGEGANHFAAEMGVQEVNPLDLVTEAARKDWEKYVKYQNTIYSQFSGRWTHSSHTDTVGAVSVDSQGCVACATSTGGITAKQVGRIGDSPLVGCGGFADNVIGAVSSTGHGEAITKVCLAWHTINLMKQGMSAQSAAEASLNFMQRRVNGAGGVIVVSSDGDFGVHFTTERMAWACIKSDVLYHGLDPGEKVILSVGDSPPETF